MLSPLELLLLGLVGIAAGFLNVMAGGGSLLSVPVMLFMGLPGPVANGTNRLAIVAQNAAAAITFVRGGYADLRLSATLALASLPGAIAGALVGVRLDGVWFERVVALVMVGVMVLMMTGTEQRALHGGIEVSPRRRAAGHLCMVGAGFWGGFLQLGVGFLFMPILHRVMGLDLVRVNMHKVFVILVYTTCALTIFALHGQVRWSVGLALAVGNSLGGWLGARTSIDRGEKAIRTVLYVALTAFVIKLLAF